MTTHIQLEIILVQPSEKEIKVENTLMYIVLKISLFNDKKFQSASFFPPTFVSRSKLWCDATRVVCMYVCVVRYRQSASASQLYLIVLHKSCWCKCNVRYVKYLSSVNLIIPLHHIWLNGNGTNSEGSWGCMHEPCAKDIMCAVSTRSRFTQARPISPLNLIAVYCTVVVWSIFLINLIPRLSKEVSKSFSASDGDC